MDFSFLLKFRGFQSKISLNEVIFCWKKLSNHETRKKGIGIAHA